MKALKISFAGTLAGTLFLAACGDDVTNISRTGLQTAASLAKLSECSSANEGETVFVADSGAVFVCKDSAWTSLENKKTDSDRSSGSDKISSSSSSDKAQSSSSQKASSSSVASGCTLTDNHDGTITQICGSDTLVSYKAFCGNAEYDPDSHFCQDDSIYEKCKGSAYRVGFDQCIDGVLYKNKVAWKYMNPDVEYKTFTDARDGQIYRTVKIGDQTWMAENLNYAGENSGLGNCPANNTDKCGIYGRLYAWTEIIGTTDTTSEFTVTNADSVKLWKSFQGPCPEGFRMPTKEDFDSLVFGLTGDSDDEDLAIPHILARDAWSSIVPAIDNNSGFSALPAGIFSMLNDVYFYMAALEGASVSYFNTFRISEREDATSMVVSLKNLGAYVLAGDMYGFMGENMATKKVSIRCIQNEN